MRRWKTVGGEKESAKPEPSSTPAPVITPPLRKREKEFPNGEIKHFKFRGGVQIRSK